MDGRVTHRSGHSAEGAVARHYADRGYNLLAQRWRCPAGEIDLILHGPAGTVFVEVKRGRSCASAAQRVGPRQSARLLSAAEVYLEQSPAGPSSPARFDVALVDRQGRIEVLENALV